MMDGDDSNGEIQRRHYENIGKAWLMAFQTLTGDDWCNQMYAYVNIFGWPAAIFYAVVFIFNNYVLMNMFIAVILEGFELAEGTLHARSIKGKLRCKVPRENWSPLAARRTQVAHTAVASVGPKGAV